MTDKKRPTDYLNMSLDELVPVARFGRKVSLFTKSSNKDGTIQKTGPKMPHNSPLDERGEK